MAIVNINTNQPKSSARQVKLMVFSFKLMRLTVGVLGLSIGILLPLLTAVITKCYHLQESISHYYYTIAGDFFVGLLCAVAFFLISYPGDGKWENIWTNIAGVCALGVAFLPTGYCQITNTCTKFSFLYPEAVSTLHLIFAAAFFIILGGVAVFQFPAKAVQTTTKSIIQRNWFYIACGVVMWVCILVLAPMPFSTTYSNYLAAHKLVFLLEVVALTAFGLCWLKKGTEL